MAHELIAYCGLYCGGCSFKVAHEENNFRHILSMPERYSRVKEELKDKPMPECPGCRLDNQCGDCAMRDCAREKELDHCALCADFPCEKITAFQSDGVPHHSEIIENLKLLRELGEEAWLERQKNQFTCSTCGERLSWYVTECTKCK